MCGIAGIFRSPWSQERIQTALEAMNAAQRHRGPDQEGCVVLKELGAGLASRRLTILDFEHGRQPLATEDESVYVVLNGEIYNHAELRQELVGKGHRFRGHSDTEVVAHLYEESGWRCLQRLEGMFALAVLDAGQRTLLLARDPMGMKHLYYAQTAQGLVFASEAKALFAAAVAEARPSLAGIDTYLALGYVPSPLTAFEGLQRLMPGQYLHVSAGAVNKDFFWRLAYQNHAARRSLDEYAEELDSLLARAVKTHLSADVAVGAFLSGGWDSSLTATYAARVSGQRLKTFSILFPGSRTMDESRYSRLMARTLGSEHHEIEFRESQIPQQLAAIARHLDEPITAAPCAISYNLAWLAAGHVKTVISGEGADELFGGYEWLRLETPYRLRPVLPKWALRRAAAWCPHRRVRRALRVLGAAKDHEADVEWRRGATPEDKRAILKPEYAAAGPDIAPVLLPADILASCADRVQRCLALEIRGRLADGILFMTDKTAMAHSLEVRMPFLDRAVVDFALRLPSQFKVHHGHEKIVLRKLAQRHLPAAVAARRKHGLGYPAGMWSKPPLREFLRTLLLDNTSRGPFRREFLERAYSRRRRSHTEEMLRRLAFLQLWWNEFF